MAKHQFAVLERVRLKLTKRTASIGYEVRHAATPEEVGEFSYVHTGRAEVTTFSYGAGGRGWESDNITHVLVDDSVVLSGQIVAIRNDPGTGRPHNACVVLDAGLGVVETLGFSKRPYVRKDGTSRPQVYWPMQRVYTDSKENAVLGWERAATPIRELYGVTDMTRDYMGENLLRKVGYPEDVWPLMLGQVYLHVPLKHLQPIKD